MKLYLKQGTRYVTQANLKIENGKMQAAYKLTDNKKAAQPFHGNCVLAKWLSHFQNPKQFKVEIEL